MFPYPDRIRVCLISLFLTGFLVGNLRADTELNIPGYRITWHDEFEGSAVDASKWDVNVGVNAWYQRQSDGLYVEPHWFNEAFEPWITAGTINDERQYYTPDNVSVEDGILVIRADHETVADPVGLYDPGYHQYTSGKLNTADEFQFRFGIVKWRAQLPSGQGMWPALWMLNAPDPWYWDDEIDVMEGRGSEPTVTTSAHHFKVGPNQDNQYNSAQLDTGLNLQEGFHEYGLEWDADSILTWFDDTQVFYDDVAIPQDPMFLIMNAAVGGQFDGVPQDNGIFPSFFRIDWVRVWQPASIPGDLASGGFEEAQGAQWANWNTLDDGNLSAVATGALHGTRSVRIDRRNEPDPGGSPPPNLFADGTAGPWRAYLNQLDESGDVLTGGEIALSEIPATTSADAVTLPIHQTAPSPGANAVVFRQLEGGTAQGRSFTWSGTVAIEESFPAGTAAIAFIRIFNVDFSFTDVKASVISGGDFSLQATIPGSDVPFVQVGLETTGPTGSTGRLAATGLSLVDDAAGTSGNADNRTGFIQTVTAVPGQAIRYGLLAANHPTDPLGAAAEGRMRLEFLDAAEGLLEESITPIVTADSPATVVPYSLETISPPGTAFARLSIERISTVPESDLAGGFLADAAFLHASGSTGLPIFTTEPAGRLVVTAGQPVDLEIGVSSPDPVDYQWYHQGEKAGTHEDVSFIATQDAAGTYFVVASNPAGPVIGAITDLIVLDDGPDSDGDGISDADEATRFGTDPSLDDSDRDGIDDYAELFLSLTDPRDASSVLKVTRIQPSGGQVELTFESVPGVSYQVQTSTAYSGWSAAGPVITATEAVTTVTVDVPVPNPPVHFFRITVIP